MKHSFGSDNHAPVHPQIMKALLECNQGSTPSYGTDPWSQRLDLRVREIFGPQAKAFAVFNGTGANVTALRALMLPTQSILVSEDSHLHQDECGAPEYLVGCKVIPLPSEDGKLTLQSLRNQIRRRGDQHFSQVAAISLTQPTELGTLYSTEEFVAITAWAQQEGLLVHIDGARFANACHRLQIPPTELLQNVDILSFGGTKNGLMFGELVVCLNPQIEGHLKYLRKQNCQLPSKTRFISAQFLRYFEDDLWLKIAAHVCHAADDLYQQICAIPGVRPTRGPPNSNAVFAQIPSSWVKELRKQHFFYVWDERSFECRWMTSWDTSSEDIESFAHALKKAYEDKGHREDERRPSS